MSSKILDCQGMLCPRPLLACRDVIEGEAPDALTVLVDDEAALENVSRYLSASGYAHSHTRQGKTWTITARRDPDATPVTPSTEDYPCPVSDPSGNQRILVFLKSENLGRGDDALGEKLMLNFIKTLPELGIDLWRVVMVNSAVKLSTRGNPALEPLQALEAAGVSILVCGTCLEFFKILDQRGVGQTTNMLDIMTSLQLAGKVIDI